MNTLNNYLHRLYETSYIELSGSHLFSSFIPFYYDLGLSYFVATGLSTNVA
ncbi:hypothetical protein C1A50_5146 [Paenibacillus polymyxa]|nr:hypothetical protein C1A50_5146 [Paenibacillus polymyxa]